MLLCQCNVWKCAHCPTRPRNMFKACSIVAVMLYDGHPAWCRSYILSNSHIRACVCHISSSCGCTPKPPFAHNLYATYAILLKDIFKQHFAYCRPLLPEFQCCVPRLISIRGQVSKSARCAGSACILNIEIRGWGWHEVGVA